MQTDWYLFYNNQQTGPHSREEILTKLKNEVTATAYVFRTGWKQWRISSDCMTELEGDTKVRTTPQVPRMPRATISGRVIVHNDGQLLVGSGVNISASGIFVSTKEALFQLGDTLKLTVKVNGMAKPFNVKAEVTRIDQDQQKPIGYGMRFIDLTPDKMHEIQNVISK